MASRRNSGESPIEEEVLAAVARPHARTECYARLLALFKTELALWELNHPDLADDERHREGLKCSVFGLAEMMEILDEYRIEYKPQYEEAETASPPPVPPKPRKPRKPRSPSNRKRKDEPGDRKGADAD